MSRYDLTPLAIAQLIGDEPAFRSSQLWHGLYDRLVEPEDCTELPKSLRTRLGATPELAPALHVARRALADDGATLKWLFSLDDGLSVEAVLMHARRRSTVCISSQAGCAMACSFCATGQAGYNRQLRVGEIVEQVVHAAREARDGGRRLDHVVFMGMGEPFANYDAVWGSVERIVGDLGLAARHVTISTVGIVPGIRRLTTEALQVNLAVSLHAANDELRTSLVPINRRYPLEVLIAACRDYVERTHRRISFEWALIDGVNDSPKDAAELSVIASQVHAHVNLIPLNPTPGYPTKGTPREGVRAFRDELVKRHVNVTVRRTRGQGIDAACGQLAALSLTS